MNEQRKIRVAVVFGGRSAEHSVSCASAAHVLPAIDPARYEVVPIGIARDGRWVLVSADPGRLAIGADGELPSVESVATRGTEIVARPGPGWCVLTALSPGEVSKGALLWESPFLLFAASLHDKTGASTSSG